MVELLVKISQIMRQLLEILWSAVSGWIPFPEWTMQVAPWVFWPLFGVMVVAVAWSQFHELRENHREAVARGEGKSNLWVTLSMTIVIGGVGFWFITS